MYTLSPPFPPKVKIKNVTTKLAYVSFCTVTLRVRRCVTVPADAASLKLQGKFCGRKNPKRTERQGSLNAVGKQSASPPAFLMENSLLPVTLPSFFNQQCPEEGFGGEHPGGLPAAELLLGGHTSSAKGSSDLTVVLHAAPPLPTPVCATVLKLV